MRSALIGLGAGIMIMSAAFGFLYAREKAGWRSADVSAPTEDSIVSVEVSPEDPPFFAPIVSTPEPTAAPPSEAPGPTETRPASEQPAGDFEIDVPKGVGSGVICAMLEDAGAVADARDFERFLYENGKETRLRYGKMRIPYNSDYYGIMEIISN